MYTYIYIYCVYIYISCVFVCMYVVVDVHMYEIGARVTQPRKLTFTADTTTCIYMFFYNQLYEHR